MYMFGWKELGWFMTSCRIFRAERISRAVLAVLAATCTALAVPPAWSDTSPELFDGLSWRCIGPAVMGGRIDDVAVVENDPATAYVATATAGLWKTTNHGTTFRPVFDEQPCQSIGAVAVCQSKPEIVWVGTGEANNRQSSSWGCGVYKSTDAGATWQHMGLSDTLHIARIVIHPTNPDVVFVAAVGHLWGPNKERGLFRTVDGGKTWKAVLQVDADTGCTDVALDPQNPSIVFAAMYQRRRAAWGFIGGGPGSGIYRSKDGGETWEKLTRGLPNGHKGRIGLDVYRKNPKIVYAVVEASDGGVFRSEDGGDSWTRMSSTNPRPMYFSLIRVDPNDDQFVWLAGVSFMRSRDGGKTFGSESGARLHADIHAIWIDPANSRHMLVGCDGGIQWSHDKGQTWDHVNTLPLAQFYGVAYDMQVPYNLAGGLQDNGSWHGPSSRPAGAGPTNADWVNIGGGDGFICAIDWEDPNTVYSESQNGAVRRVNLSTGASKSIAPVAPPGEPRYRWDWCTPFMLSPHNPRKVLLGGNRLFISSDRGDTWRRTEDLSTSPNVSEFVLMGVKRGRGYPFPDISSDYGQIVTLTESPVREGIIYAGTDDGNLQVSRDDGRTWRNVAANVPGLPKGTYVSRVHASYHAEGRVYASFDGHRSDDYTPYIYVSEDFGTTWRRITDGIPIGSTVNVVRDCPDTPNLLFAGTDRGLYVSLDRGEHWRRFGMPLPPLRVDEVLVHPRDKDLIVATHARGVYILDNISILIAEASGRPSSMALLPPRPAVQYRGGFGMSSLTGNRQFLTRGGLTGAQIRYWLPREPKLDERLTLSVETKRGKTVSTRRLVLANAGYNTTTWDLRADPPASSTLASTVQAGSGPSAGSGNRPSSSRRQPQRGAGSTSGRGPRVPPGEYLVRLRMGDAECVQKLRVMADPRADLSTRQYERLYSMANELSEMAARAREKGQQLAVLEQALDTAARSDGMKAEPLAVSKVQALLKEVRSLRSDFAGTPSPQAETPVVTGTGQVTTMSVRTDTSLASALARYASTLDSMPELPSRALAAEMAASKSKARRLIATATELLGGRLAKLNAALLRSNLPAINPRPEGEATAGVEESAEPGEEQETEGDRA